MPRLGLLLVLLAAGGCAASCAASVGSFPRRFYDCLETPTTFFDANVV